MSATRYRANTQRGMVMDLVEALDRLPKVELHCHIEGTMRPQTVADLAAKNGRTLPVDDPADLYRYGSLDEFLSVFWLVQECLGDREDWARLAYESVLDGAAHGLVYRESFFTPARHLEMGQRLDDIVAGLEEGLAAGEQETGARVMLIADMDRAYGGQPGLEMIEGVVELKRQGKAERVIGMGMDSTELGVDPADFLPAYRLGRSSGLRLTAHQGENSPPSAIVFDVEELGAERIDHGISILDDPAAARLMRDRGIPLTVCPISNVEIANLFGSVAEHPWPQMQQAGLHVTLNTDDPAMIEDDLGKEYATLAEAHSYGFPEMVDISLAGADATWLAEDELRRLRERIITEAADLQRQLDG
jgi:adenosine deaminase